MHGSKIQLRPYSNAQVDLKKSTIRTKKIPFRKRKGIEIVKPDAY